MSKLYALMNDFHAAILDKDAASFAPQVSPNPRLPAETQMAIYVEGYRIRLLEAISSDYKATIALLGQPAFDKLALAFIESHAPQHFNLDHYPIPFATYIRDHAGDPFAADLATLESTISEMFLMGESAPLAAAALSSLTPEDFSAMLLVPRTASRLLQMEFPANATVNQFRAEDVMQRPEGAASYLYVVRHENKIERHELSLAEYRVLQQLSARIPVGAALDHVAENYPELLPDIAANIQSWFRNWTMHGFFQSLPEYCP